MAKDWAITELKQKIEDDIKDENARKSILNLFANVIEKNYDINPSNWNVSYRIGGSGLRFQLNVGHTYILGLYKDCIIVMCEKESFLSLSEDFRNELSSKTSETEIIEKDGILKICGEKCIQVKIPFSKCEKYLGTLEPAICDFAKWCTENRKLNPESEDAHVPAFIDYLNQELKTKIPQPEYEGEWKNISYIMANISWNENDWKSPSFNKTNFRYTHVEGNIPNESWNFDFDNPRNSEKEILGFTQFKNPPKNAEKDKFLIIFRSDNKIIGFYGNAEIKKVPLMIKEGEYVNLFGDKKLSVLLENKIDDSNHNFLFGKDRISQGGFNNLKPIDAKTILDEAIKTNPNQNDTLTKIKEWLNQGDTQMTAYEKKLNEIKNNLKENRNIILTGAPGTGKTFMAKQIAKELGCEDDNIGFVQFHPSYDYTDFVEGLRPTDKDGNGNVGFERRDGVFKEFCVKALKNLVDSKKSVEEVAEEKDIARKIEYYLDDSIKNKKEFLLKNGNKFNIVDYDDKWIFVEIPNNSSPDLKVSKLDIINIFEKNIQLNEVKDVRLIHSAQTRQQQDSYVFVICKEIEKLKISSPKNTSETAEKIPLKNFVFIIDEINRGEVAKIFGELFYCIDPGYRGEKGRISTQYQNLVTSGEFQKGFFIPENVYIIGTMNDIDRSVESMDFAFRRRFSWIEVKASDTVDMLYPSTNENGESTGLESKELADEAKRRMENLNNAISEIDGLNEAYHIGASYFLKLKNYGGNQDERFKSLWEYHIKGILQEYLRGNPNGKLDDLKAAYDREKEKKDGE